MPPLRYLQLMVLRPQEVLKAARESRSPWDGALPMVLVGVVWALFCGILNAAGHEPTVTLLPIPKSSYYLFQTIVLTPLLVALWWLLVRVAFYLSGAKPEQRWPLAAALGYAYAGPLFWAFVIPDLVIYTALGHESMGQLLRYYAPLAPLWSLAFGTMAIHRITDARPWRALGAMLAAYLVQAMVAGVVLR